MLRNKWTLAVLTVALLGLTARGWASEEMEKKLRDLKAELDSLRNELNRVKSMPSGPASACTGMLGEKDPRMYGPNTLASTKNGRLTIGGLLQVWYYHIEDDKYGLWGRNRSPGVTDLNDFKDNDGRAIRRAEISFTMDIHEWVQAYVMIDPATEIWNRQSFNSTLGAAYRTPSVPAKAGVVNPTVGNLTASPSTNSFTPTLLRDAYVRMHDVLPWYHTMYVGQYVPATIGGTFDFDGPKNRGPIGTLEGGQSSKTLEFAERSMIGQVMNDRDLGATLKGEQLDGRIGYSIGVFNSPGLLLTGRPQMSRADTNDDKDFIGTLVVRPVWGESETWGKLELGYYGRVGQHGEQFQHGSASSLGIKESTSWTHDIYAIYKPGGPVEGLWLRAEWAWMHDRFSGVPAVNADGSLKVTPAVYFTDTTGKTQMFSQAAVATLATSGANAVHPITVDGGYAAIGYKFSHLLRDYKSKIECFNPKNLELAYRFETFENILVQDVRRMDARKMVAFATNIHTIGLNYYMKDNNAKLQLNYSFVDEETSPRYRMRDVKNNNLVASFQVAF